MEDIKFGNLTVTEADREFSKDFGKDKGIFTVRIPLPYQKASIFSSTSRAIGGLDVKSVRPEDYEYIRMIVTLNAVVVKSPQWWMGADNCPDDDFNFELWKFFLESESKFQGKLKKNVDIKTVEGAK